MHSQSVRVAIRCRPISDDEKTRIVVQCDQQEVSLKLSAEDKISYHFDKVFNSAASQEFVYRSVVAEVVEDTIKGFNCTVFAYGQTGTGKTFTMEGHRTEIRKGDSPFWYGEHAGMIPRAAQHIFQRMDACSNDYSVKVSYLELYNEDVFDLLQESGLPKSLQVLQSENGKGVMVAGLQQFQVNSPEDIFRILESAANRRHVAETDINKKSSRSHCIFTITIRIKEIAENGEESIRVGKLNLVDLAGSENVKKSGVKDVTMKQATMINKSLLTLRRVITALSSDRVSHIPFRDSKLTRLLQESLGGKSKTCMIATISPSAECLEETKSTLQYALSAKSIKNTPVLNQTLSKKAMLKSFQSEIESLRNQLAASKSAEGIYVDNQTHETYLHNLEKYSELSTALENKEQHIGQLEEQDEQRSAEYNENMEKKIAIESEYNDVESQVMETENQLTEKRAQIIDQNARMHMLQQTETELNQLANQFIKNIKQNQNEIALLHEKTNIFMKIYTENRHLSESVKNNINQQLNDSLANLQQFYEQNGVSLAKYSKSWSHIKTKNIASLDSLKGEQEIASSRISDLSNFIQEKINAQNQMATSFFHNKGKSSLLTHVSNFTDASLKKSTEFYDEQDSNLCKLRNGSELYQSFNEKRKHMCEDVVTSSNFIHQQAENDINSSTSLNEAHHQSVSAFHQQSLKAMGDQGFLLGSMKKLIHQSFKNSQKTMMEEIQEALEEEQEHQEKLLEKSLKEMHSILENAAKQANEYENVECKFSVNISDNLNLQKSSSQNRLEFFNEQYSSLLSSNEKFEKSNSKLIQSTRSHLKQCRKTEQNQWAEFLKTNLEIKSYSNKLNNSITQLSNSLHSANHFVAEFFQKQINQPIDASLEFINGHQLTTAISSLNEYYQQLSEQQKEQIQMMEEIVNKQFSNLKTYESSSMTPKKITQYPFPTSLPRSRPIESILNKKVSPKNVETQTQTSSSKEQKQKSPAKENINNLNTATTHQVSQPSPKKPVTTTSRPRITKQHSSTATTSSTATNGVSNVVLAKRKPTTNVTKPPVAKKRKAQ